MGIVPAVCGLNIGIARQQQFAHFDVTCRRGDVQGSTTSNKTENEEHISKTHAAVGIVLAVCGLNIGIVRQ